MNRGDVILADFPYYDRPGHKRRLSLEQERKKDAAEWIC
jgi:hypothetical protein